MATLTTEPNGRRLIRFKAPNGKRPKILLGEMDLQEAKKIADHVEHLADCWRRKHPPSKGTEAWLAELLSDPTRDWLFDRLAAAGLVVALESPESPPPKKTATPKPKKAETTRPMPTTLGPFLDELIASRTDVKPGTLTNYKQVRANLVEFFKGEGKPLGDVNPGDADDFRRWLRGEKNLAENTARRRCARAREFFLVAVRKRIIAENPFGHLKHLNVKSNKARQFFITREVAYTVLDSMIDGDGEPLVQWQLIFALNRFGALRCPSEISLLTWDDIDWRHKKITVHSPKTEQYEGKESRVMPLFPELLPYLKAAWKEATSEGRHQRTDYVVAEGYRGAGKNLGTQLKRFLARAGVQPWPKLMNNLRSSRCTELNQTFPEWMVAQWCGHSEKVAEEHYLQITEGDWERAASQPTGDIGLEKRGAEKGRKPAENTPQTKNGEQDGKVQVAKKVLDQQRLGQEKRGDFSPPLMTPTGLEPVLPP